MPIHLVIDLVNKFCCHTMQSCERFWCGDPCNKTLWRRPCDADDDDMRAQLQHDASRDSWAHRCRRRWGASDSSISLISNAWPGFSAAQLKASICEPHGPAAGLSHALSARAAQARVSRRKPPPTPRPCPTPRPPPRFRRAAASASHTTTSHCSCYSLRLTCHPCECVPACVTVRAKVLILESWLETDIDDIYIQPTQTLLLGCHAPAEPPPEQKQKSVLIESFVSSACKFGGRSVKMNLVWGQQVRQKCGYEAPSCWHSMQWNAMQHQFTSSDWLYT